jgi:tight adherence protein C
MTTAQLVLLAVAFLAGTLGSYAVMRILSTRHEASRIASVAVNGADTREGLRGGASIAVIGRFLFGLGHKFRGGGNPEDSPHRLRFLRAGLRETTLPAIHAGLKLLLACAMPAIFLLVCAVAGTRFGWNAKAILAALLAPIGYLLPDLWLNWKIRRRQRELAEKFPDAIDMIRLCVEAGLGLDAAIARVEREISLTCKPLYEELRLVNLELRAGASRERALKNLAQRIGLSDVDSLVAMLIQVERFGTNIAESLRIHSDTLRANRRRYAEEQAAKVPVKLLFPMIFCIFPSLMVALLGPALINIMRMLKPGMLGH